MKTEKKSKSKIYSFLRFCLICGFGLMSYFSTAHANNVVNISNDFPIIRVLKNTEIMYLEDKPSIMTTEEILKNIDSFIPYNTPHQIDTKKTYWVKLAIKNNLETRTSIRIVYPSWKDSQTFLIANNKILTKLRPQGRSGTFNEFADVNPYTTPVSTLADQFAVINIDSNQTITVISKLKSDRIFSARNIVPTLMEHNAYSQMRRLGIYIEGFMIGSVFALMIFSAFSAFRNKEKTLALYSIWLFTAVASVLTQNTHDGIRFSEFFVDTSNITLNSQVPIAWAIWIFFAFAQAMMYVVFARSFLDLKIHYPKVHTATNLYLLWYGFFYLIDIIFQPFVYSKNPDLYIVLPHLIATPIILMALFVCAFLRYRQGMVIAKYYMMAAIPYLFFRSIFLSGWVGIPNPFSYLPNSGIGLFFQSSSTIQILGMFLESLIMALAVVARTRYLQEKMTDKIESQKNLLDQQNIDLETKIKARTSELISKTESLETASKNLAKFLPPQMHEAIFSGKHDTEIKTRRKKLTIFFSDIQNFTTTSENLQPEDLTRYLNEYFSEMTAIAIRNGGTIDKYMGDAMMVFFGDPDTKGNREDARSCVKMALEMQKKMFYLQEKWKGEGFSEPFKIRMGLNTGYCNVGNFGSEQRLTYTIIGAEVNVAQRLESAADVGGILMSYETYAYAKDMVQVQERESIQMKGIARRIKLLSVINSGKPQLEPTKPIEKNKATQEDVSEITKLKNEVAEIKEFHRKEISNLRSLITKITK